MAAFASRRARTWLMVILVTLAASAAAGVGGAQERTPSPPPEMTTSDDSSTGSNETSSDPPPSTSTGERAPAPAPEPSAGAGQRAVMPAPDLAPRLPLRELLQRDLGLNASTAAAVEAAMAAHVEREVARRVDEAERRFGVAYGLAFAAFEARLVESLERQLGFGLPGVAGVGANAIDAATGRVGGIAPPQRDSILGNVGDSVDMTFRGLGSVSDRSLSGMLPQGMPQSAVPTPGVSETGSLPEFSGANSGPFATLPEHSLGDPRLGSDDDPPPPPPPEDKRGVVTRAIHRLYEAISPKPDRDVPNAVTGGRGTPVPDDAGTSGGGSRIGIVWNLPKDMPDPKDSVVNPGSGGEGTTSPQGKIEDLMLAVNPFVWKTDPRRATHTTPTDDAGGDIFTEFDPSTIDAYEPVVNPEREQPQGPGGPSLG